MNFRPLLLMVFCIAGFAPLNAYAQNVSFGDNSSDWANDGECDDPRFAGSGVADILLDEDRGHDANDCRSALKRRNDPCDRWQ